MFSLRPARRAVVFAAFCAVAVLQGPICAQDTSARFDVRDGDRVLFLGDTLLEREGTYGYLETELHTAFPTKHFTVRNLAFSADTPHGLSRSVFDPPDKGWERLKEQIAMVKPTVVFLGYGMAASMDFVGSPTDRMAESQHTTAEKVARFRKEMTELMDTIQAEAKGDGATATTPLRFVLVSPIRHQDLRATSPGLPDPAAHNEVLVAITASLKQLAQERGALFVDCFTASDAAAGSGTFRSAPAADLSNNGIHLTEKGYQLWAQAVAADLGVPAHTLQKEDSATPPKQAGAAEARSLRSAIVRKNELFFHRWRPQNQTYLFGFRKHEQGQNAKEIPQFDPLIDAGEAEIDQLKRGASAGAPVAAAPSAADPGAAIVAAQKAVTPLPLPQFDVQNGYEITLWAENPLLDKPIQMNWDAQGRLWVAASSTYPQIEPGAAERDRILVLQDTDHDGRADKSSVFSEGLLIPTGIAPNAANATAPGEACYVAASTELLKLTDSDGDGKADQREVVLSGFGTEDTHHILHALRWSPDGRLYFNQSVYIHSHIETPWGVVRQNSGGIFAWDPRTQRLEVMYNGIWNPWGTAWDKSGEAFFTDGAGFEGINWGVRGAGYQTYEGSRRLLQSISPGSYPKFAGLELIQSPHFPQEWQGSAVTCDFRAHRVVHFGMHDLQAEASKSAGAGVVAAPGQNAAIPSGYITNEMPDLVRTSDVSFRPIDVKLGPDGALYVADWSNPVINHGEVDFRDPRRDHTHGRIWRIARKGAPAVQWEALAAKGSEALIPKLLSENTWEQQQARRVLAGRPANEVMQPLGAALQQSKADEFRREVLWLTSALGEGDRWDLRFELAKSGNPDMRAVAARAIGTRFPVLVDRMKQAVARQRLDSGNPQAKLPVDGNTWTDFTEVLPKLAADSSPRVRLEAVRALATAPSDEPRLATSAVETVLKTAPVGTSGAAPTPGDAFYDYAAWLSINDLAEPWSKAVLSGDWKLDSPARERQLEWALGAIDPAKAAPLLAKILETHPITPEAAGPWADLIGKAGSASEVEQLLNKLADGFFTAPGAAAKVARAIGEAARLRNVTPNKGGAQEKTLALLESTDPAVQLEAAKLVGQWKVAAALPRLVQWAQGQAAAGKSPELRSAAFGSIRGIGGKQAEAALLDLASAAQPAETRRQAALALASLDLKRGIAFTFDALQGSTEPEALNTWRALLQIKGAPEAAADAVAAASAHTVAAGQASAVLTGPSATAGLRAAREAGKKAEKLVAALATITKANPNDLQPQPQNYAGVADTVKRDGDPSRGEEIFRRAELGCVTCHAIGGAGGKVGPELTSLGASAPLDYIIESVLNPAAKVKEGYNAVTLTLKDGSVASGIQARETATEIFLRNVAGQETGVVKANITGKENVGSMMPAGLTAALQSREQIDLFAFLAQLGKPGVYDASKGTVARTWKLLPGTEVDKAISGKADLSTAAAAYTHVDGRLTRDQLQAALQLVPNGAETSVAVTRFQLPTAGETRLNLSGVSKAWLDGQALAVASEPKVVATLAAGEHTLAVKLDSKQLPEVLRAESENVRFLTE